METDREVNMLIAMLVTAINAGKKERRTNEFSRDVMRLKAELLTEKNQSEEYNRAWQWSHARIEEIKSQLNERNETIRQEREKMAHLEKLYSELEKQCEWYGQMEVNLRMELSETKEMLQDAQYETRQMFLGWNDDRINGGFYTALVDDAV